MLVIDGNMKNNHDVYLAKDAGYIEFAGIPGKVKTGCQATPQYNSRYCSSHAPLACNFKAMLTDDEEASALDLGNGALSKFAKEKDPGNVVAEVITAKKTTRKETYYQVIHFITIAPVCSKNFIEVSSASFLDMLRF